MILTPEQVCEFEENGFLLLRGFADKNLCDEMRSLAKRHLDTKIEPIESEEEYNQKDSSIKTVRRLRQVYDRDPLFASWMTDSKIRPLLAQLLGEEPVLLLAHHNSIMTKQPHISTITSWHQDIRYWHYQNEKLLSVWLSLGDEYLENGLLEFIPGSHKMKLSSECFDESSTFRDETEHNKEIISKRVHFDLQKGDVVLFHAKTLHFAHQNRSAEVKISFVYSVRAASNKPIKNTISDFREINL